MRVGLAGMAVLLLAACGEGQQAEGDAGEPSQVLEGTASDAMLPLATVTSRPPLAAPEPDSSTGRGPATEPTVVPSAGPSAEATPDSAPEADGAD